MTAVALSKAAAQSERLTPRVDEVTVSRRVDWGLAGSAQEGLARRQLAGRPVRLGDEWVAHRGAKKAANAAFIPRLNKRDYLVTPGRRRVLTRKGTVPHSPEEHTTDFTRREPGAPAGPCVARVGHIDRGVEL